MADMAWQTDGWEWISRQGIHWAQDSRLMGTGMVKQGFLGRLGGISAQPYASLNLGFGSGDDRPAVMENRRRVAEALDLPLHRWSCLKQVHETTVMKITAKEANLGAMEPGTLLPRADAQITDEAGVILVTQHADCLPLYLLDPAKPAIGLAHAGWRGTLQNIAGVLVAAMTAHFGSKPADLLAAVGPGAGSCHYEVDEPVLEAAERCFQTFPGALRQILTPSANPGRAYIDLGSANAFLLEKSGVPAGQISVSGICTICENHRVYSYRMKDRGRQAAFFSLR